MKLLYSDEADNSVVLILTKKENDAMALILGEFLKTKPNKRSLAYKLAEDLDGRLLV